MLALVLLSLVLSFMAIAACYKVDLRHDRKNEELLKHLTALRYGQAQQESKAPGDLPAHARTQGPSGHAFHGHNHVIKQPPGSLL